MPLHHDHHVHLVTRSQNALYEEVVTPVLEHGGCAMLNLIAHAKTHDSFSLEDYAAVANYISRNNL